MGIRASVGGSASVTGAVIERGKKGTHRTA